MENPEKNKDKKYLNAVSKLLVFAIIITTISLITVASLVIFSEDQEEILSKNQPELYTLLQDYRKTVETSNIIREKCKDSSIVYKKKQFFIDPYKKWQRTSHNTIFYNEKYDHKLDIKSEEFQKKFRKDLKNEFFTSMERNFPVNQAAYSWIWIFEYYGVNFIVQSVII